jgi:hypothetical protein
MKHAGFAVPVPSDMLERQASISFTCLEISNHPQTDVAEVVTLWWCTGLNSHDLEVTQLRGRDDE